MARTGGHAQERSTTNGDATTAFSKPDDEDTPERLEMIQSALAAHNKMAFPPDDPKEYTQEAVKQSSEERAGDSGLGGLGDVYRERGASLSKDLCSGVSILSPF